MMMPNYIEVVGVGVLALMILKEVFSFLKAFIDSRSNGNGNGKTKIDIHDVKKVVDKLQNDVDDVKSRTKDLWIWHEKEMPGEPGVKVWYPSAYLKDAMEKIASSLEKLTDMHEQMHDDIKEIKDINLAARKRPTRRRSTKKKS